MAVLIISRVTAFCSGVGVAPELCLCSALPPVGHTSEVGPNGWLSHSDTLSLWLLGLPGNCHLCSPIWHQIVFTFLCVSVPRFPHI